jgi:glycine/D-amino acid oxidase-like deaminating enzyme
MNSTVLIVGAGIVGASLAHELTRRGASVTVIDAAESASGTSAASFAWVNANKKTPKEYEHLNLLGLRAHERALRSSTQGIWFHQTGNIELAQSPAAAARLEEKVHQLALNDYGAVMLTAAQVEELEPGLRAEDLVGGALYPREGWIDTTTMCSTLLHRASEQGATFVPFHHVTDITSRGVKAIGPDGDTAHFAADIVVLAAGNGTRALLASHDIDFPTLDPAWRDDGGAPNPTVGLISTTGPVSSGIRHMVRAEGIALRPARNGGITFADHPTGAQWDRTDPRIWTVPSELLHRARQLFPSLDRVSVETVTLGTRVLPTDGVTIADWIASDARLYAIATHSGVTLAAHLAEVVTDEILTGNRHSSLQPFGLSRFAHN